ncbi:hypothetical protein ACLOJK_022511 [Asimina triloba]
MVCEWSWWTGFGQCNTFWASLISRMDVTSMPPGCKIPEYVLESGHALKSLIFRLYGSFGHSKLISSFMLFFVVFGLYQNDTIDLTCAVNNRGRYPAARGGGSSFRSEGMRGRGNYGNSRNYGRGDFGNRTDFINRNTGRGGPSRGGDGGYQRIDQFGNNGGRVNRSSGLGVAKTDAPRVSASA